MIKYCFHARQIRTKELMRFTVVHTSVTEARRIAEDWTKASNYIGCTLYCQYPFNPIGNIYDIEYGG
jgi:hypothetical protein